MDEKFIIKNISKEQLNIMTKALEFYNRFLFWQVQAIPDVLIFRDKEIDHEKLNKAFLDLKNSLFPELMNNESYWIWNYKKLKWTQESFKLNWQISYEMFKDINKFLYFLSNGKKDSYFNVDADWPLRYSDEWEIKIEKETWNESVDNWKKVNKKEDNIIDFNDIPF